MALPAGLEPVTVGLETPQMMRAWVAVADYAGERPAVWSGKAFDALLVWRLGYAALLRDEAPSSVRVST